jgi:hypothetical protein
LCTSDNEDSEFNSLHAHLMKTNSAFEKFNTVIKHSFSGGVTLPAKNAIILFVLDSLFRHRITTEIMMSSLAENVAKTVSKLRLPDGG